jgi:hypothetical protein
MRAYKETSAGQKDWEVLQFGDGCPKTKREWE